MLYYAKAANFDSTHNQLTMIWNRLYVILRRDIPEPSMATIFAMFFRHINSKTSIWREMADRPPPPQQSFQQRQYQSPQQRPPYNPPPQRQDRQQHQARGGENKGFQGGFAPRISVGDGKQHAFLAEVTPDGNSVYEDGEGHN